MAGFMELQLHGPCRWYRYELGNGDSYVVEYEAPPSGEDFTMEVLGEGYAARYSAPGYLDATPFTFSRDPVKALQECADVFMDDESPEERAELAACLWQAKKLRWERRRGQ